jgi:hypothetical protein
MRTAIVLVSLLTACADSSFDAADDPGGGSGNDQAEDQGMEEEGETPPGPGATACKSNEHACDMQCVTDRANTPEAGCAMGCGGACPVPANGTAMCDAAGVCGSTCNDGFTRIGDQCVSNVCEAVGYSCGTYGEGTGAVSCGSCLDGATCGLQHACTRPRDVKETNDTLAAATPLGDLKDSDDARVEVGGLSIDSAQDVDWFKFHVTDGFDGGNPDAHVTLSHTYVTSGYDVGWLSDPHELTVWFKCDGEDNGSSVECGEWYSTMDTDSLHDPALGVGCKVNATYLVWAHVSASCSTTSDNGTVTVRVKKNYVPMGDTYDLDVLVE